MPQHCATMQNSALDAALGAPTDALQKTCATRAVVTVGMRTDASPGEGAETASPTTHRLGTHAPRPLEDPQRKPPSIDPLLVSRETSDHEYSVGVPLCTFLRCSWPTH